MRQMMDLIESICQFSPRQGEGERHTAQYIKELLATKQIACISQFYRTSIPIILAAELTVGDQMYRTPTIAGCSFVSGTIEPTSPIVDARGSSSEGNAMGTSLLACNPQCLEASQANFYSVPAIAIPPWIQERIVTNNIPFHGKVDVMLQEHTSENILVGNVQNPRAIVLTHYDSIGYGALDNASGVAVVLSCLQRFRERLQDTLFALCGSEELSHERNPYHGYGYRIAEQGYLAAFENADSIHIVDSVGNRPPKIIEEKASNSQEDRELFERALSAAAPLHHSTHWRNKIRIYGGDDIPMGMFTVYHSNLDNGDMLREDFLEQTLVALHKQLQNK